jgi:hypothetical protein
MMALLLVHYSWADMLGLTAEQAATSCGFDAASGAWKRVSDLRSLGYIKPMVNEKGREVSRRASSGRQQRVLVITRLGRLVVEEME